MASTTRQKAQSRLTEVQAQLYINGLDRQRLEDEAKSLAAYINIAAQEDMELAEAEKAATSTGGNKEA